MHEKTSKVHAKTQKVQERTPKKLGCAGILSYNYIKDKTLDLIKKGSKKNGLRPSRKKNIFR